MKKNIWANALILAGFLYAAIVLTYFPKWTVDDAFITFRYAENLAEHGQLNWNIGEQPIEGYTGVALPLILALGIKLGISPPTLTHIIGISAYFFTALMLFFVLKKLNILNYARVVILGLYFTFPFLFTHAWSGLETMLFLAGITIVLFAYLKTVFNEWPIRYLMLCLFATSLIRPEGVALSLIMIGISGYWLYKNKRSGLKIFLRQSLLWFFLPAAVYFFWRLHYYGDWLPSTYYAKAIAGFHLNHLKDLVHFLINFFAAPAFAVSLLLTINPDQIKQELSVPDEQARTQAIMGLIIGGMLFIFAVAMQFTGAKLRMNYSYRFFVPFIPIILITFGIIAHYGSQMLIDSRKTHPLRFTMICILLSLTAILQLLTVTHRLKDETKFADQWKKIAESQYVPASQFINQTVPHNEWLAVLYDAGMMPYLTRLKTVDMGGIIDLTISKKHLPIEKFPDYFFSYNPGVAVFTSEAQDKLVHGPQTAIISADPRFKANYTLAKQFELPPSVVPYYEFVYLRNDLLPK